MATPQFYQGKARAGYFEKYGLNWKDGTPALQVELACFREKLSKRIPWALGGSTPMRHFKVIAKAFWPENDDSVPFIWNRWSDLLLKAFCENNYVAVAGNAGSGKTNLAAIWLIVQFLCDPENTLAITTSRTLSVSKLKAWAKIVLYWSPLEKLGMPGKLLDSIGRIRYMDPQGKASKGDLAGIALVPSERKQEKEALNSIGIHPRRAIFVADDLTELSDALMEAALGNLSMGTEYYQFIGLANPISYYDAFGRFAEPKDGYNAITVNDEMWETKHGIGLHLDATCNPRITEGDERLFWLPSAADIEHRKEIDGANSATFWRFVRGWWAPEGVQEFLYSEIEIMKSGADKPAVWLDNNQYNVAFLDPSFTNQGDRCIAFFGKYGKNNHGYDVLEYGDHLIFHEDITDKSQDRTRQLIYWFRDNCIERNVYPGNAGMDSTGAGDVLLADMRLFWNKDVVGINFGGAASDLPVSVYDPTPGHEKYCNRISEIWSSIKEALRTDQIKGMKPELIKEACLRKYTQEKGLNLRMRVQRKVEMKLEIGSSPDLSDAALGLAQLCKQRWGFNTSKAALEKYKTTSGKGKTMKELFKKLNATIVYTQPVG